MGKIIIIIVLVITGIILRNQFKKAAKRNEDEAAAQGSERYKRESVEKARIYNTLSKATFPIFFVIASIIFIFSVIRIIPAGHVGVVTLFGKVNPRQLDEGLHLTNPLIYVTKMSVQVQKDSNNYDSASKDMQTVHVMMLQNYRLLPDKAPIVYQSIGKEYASVILNTAAHEVLKANTAKLNAAEILQDRAHLKAIVQEDLTKWVLKYGIEIKEVSLANISFDPTYAAAIERKQVQQQLAEQKNYELQQAQIQAQILETQSKGKADSTVAAAKGYALALNIKGKAEADYNSKVSASLTQILIQQQYLVRWNGQLPQFMSGGQGGASSFLFQIPTNTKLDSVDTSH